MCSDSILWQSILHKNSKGPAIGLQGEDTCGQLNGPQESALKVFLAQSTTICRLRLPENNVLCYSFRKATGSQGNRNVQFSYVLRGPPCTGGPLLTERSLRGT